MSETLDEFVPLGHVSAVYGVKGWIKVFSHSRPMEAIGKYSTWYLGGEHRPYTVETAKLHSKTVIAKLEGVNDRDEAEQLIKQDIAVMQSDLPVLNDDEFYWRDLIGLQVTNLEGCVLGAVVQMMETGAHDVMVVEDNERQRLIPFVDEVFVREIDLIAGKVLVDWHPED